MATHALLAREGLGLGSLAGLLASLSPALASACPYCAGRSGGTTATGVVLTSFVLLPFLVTWLVYRVVRAEARAGDASMLDVTEHATDRPIRARASQARAPRARAPQALLHHRLRREAE